MNIGDERYVRYSLANLLQRHCRIIVRDRKSDNLTTSAHHLLDLRDCGANVGSVSLGHRLDRDRRATTNLNVLNLNGSRFTHVCRVQSSTSKSKVAVCNTHFGNWTLRG